MDVFPGVTCIHVFKGVFPEFSGLILFNACISRCHMYSCLQRCFSLVFRADTLNAVNHAVLHKKSSIMFSLFGGTSSMNHAGNMRIAHSATGRSLLTLTEEMTEAELNTGYRNGGNDTNLKGTGPWARYSECFMLRNR